MSPRGSGSTAAESSSPRRCAAAGALAIEVRALPAYTPHLKGAVERVNESIEQLLLARLPGFLHGSTDQAGRAIDRDAPRLSLEGFVALFADFVQSYNTEHPHEGLGGRTPVQQWESDATPVHTVDPARLRHLMLARSRRLVTKKGVRLAGRTYNCAELCGWVGEWVEVRSMPHHEREVEVFVRGEHLGTARLVDELSVADRKRLLAHRAEDARWLAKQQRAAASKRRTVYAAMTEPGAPRSVSVIVEAPGELVGYGDDDQRTAASRSLVDSGPVPDRMVAPMARTLS